MDLPQKERRFQKYYDELIWQTQNASAHLRLWERFQKYRAKDGYLDQLNLAPHFFSFTIQAHLDAALLSLSRILDKRCYERNDSLSIWKFLNFAGQNREIFSTQAFRQRMKGNSYYESLTGSHTPITPKEVDEDRQKLERLVQTMNNLTTWRDKVIAHIDRDFLLSGRIVSKEYPLKLQQLQEVIDTVFGILNRYSYAYKSSTCIIGIPGEDDIQNVMDAISFYIIEKNKGVKRDFVPLP